MAARGRSRRDAFPPNTCPKTGQPLDRSPEQAYDSAGMGGQRTKTIVVTVILTALALMGIGGAVWSVQHGGHGNPFDVFKGSSYIPMSPGDSLFSPIETLPPDVLVSKNVYCTNVRHGTPVLVYVGVNPVVHCVLPDGRTVGTP
jgi:hypothetical protein